jgi:hypothetical protein
MIAEGRWVDAAMPNESHVPKKAATSEAIINHWSDCALHNAPALPIGPCNCGYPDFAIDDLHDRITAFVFGAGSVRILISHMGREGFVEPEQLKSHGLAAYAATANLPNAHDFVTILGHPDSMNLNDARETVISQLKALSCSEGCAGNSVQHSKPPLSRGD